MADVVDKATRSRMMAGIRSRDTRPEKTIRSLLHTAGFRFRLHDFRLPGRPDIVLRRYRAAIHVHGCFWHGHSCNLYKLPKTRREFWKAKIAKNRKRDRDVTKSTVNAGWRHLAIWECAFRGPKQIGIQPTVKRTIAWIQSKRTLGEIRSKT